MNCMIFMNKQGSHKNSHKNSHNNSHNNILASHKGMCYKCILKIV